jgi:hypothetical protein
MGFQELTSPSSVLVLLEYSFTAVASIIRQFKQPDLVERILVSWS